jgi:hypothetical protein
MASCIFWRGVRPIVGGCVESGGVKQMHSFLMFGRVPAGARQTVGISK